MRELSVFIGGVSGIGKSRLATELARRHPWLTVVEFSELMLPHLQEGLTRDRISCETTQYARSRARFKALADLSRVSRPNIVTGHYALCLFDDQGRLVGIEPSAPPALMDRVSAVILAKRERRTPKLPIGVTVVDKHATRQLQLSEDMEKAVHDFIEDTTSLPSLVVDLSLGNRAVEEAALFIRGVFRE